jgi:ABC-type multidrug transport system ATPase subunit
MDEAELLGDRIAIINYGKLQCVGTSLFLKNALAEGTNLTIEKNLDKINKQNIEIKNNDLFTNDMIIQDDEQTFEKQKNLIESIALENLNNILNFIKKFAPSVYLKEENFREYTFIIPLIERSNPKFWNLFEELDKYADQLNIKSYG